MSIGVISSTSLHAQNGDNKCSYLYFIGKVYEIPDVDGFIGFYAYELLVKSPSSSLKFVKYIEKSTDKVFNRRKISEMEKSENDVYIPNDSAHTTFDHISPWFCEIRKVEGE